MNVRAPESRLSTLDGSEKSPPRRGLLQASYFAGVTSLTGVPCCTDDRQYGDSDHNHRPSHDGRQGAIEIRHCEGLAIARSGEEQRTYSDPT
jgi:hypothetical protein